MCSLAFFAFLRIGEITSPPKQNSNPPLQLFQLTKLVNSAGNIEALKVSFGNFKHSYNARPFSLEIAHQKICCPVQLFLNYLALRGSGPGPIFMTLEGAAV